MSFSAPRRVSFQVPPPRRGLSSGINHLGYSDYSSEEEEEERRLAQEEAEERALSEEHEEAKESGGAKRSSKTQTDEQVEAEYARKSKRRCHVTITPAQLLGNKGLLRVKNEFDNTITPPSKGLQAAAAYSRNLIRSYQTFCYDLCPDMAFEDSLVKIESLGSKKEVKSYLQTMRDEVRNQYLRSIYGEEKARKMISELQEGLMQESVLQSVSQEIEEQVQRRDPPSMEDESSTAQENSRPAGNSNQSGTGDENVIDDTSPGKERSSVDDQSTNSELEVGVKSVNSGSTEIAKSETPAEAGTPVDDRTPSLDSNMLINTNESDEEEWKEAATGDRTEQENTLAIGCDTPDSTDDTNNRAEMNEAVTENTHGSTPASAHSEISSKSRASVEDRTPPLDSNMPMNTHERDEEWKAAATGDRIKRDNMHGVGYDAGINTEDMKDGSEIEESSEQVSVAKIMHEETMSREAVSLESSGRQSNQVSHGTTSLRQNSVSTESQAKQSTKCTNGSAYTSAPLDIEASVDGNSAVMDTVECVGTNEAPVADEEEKIVESQEEQAGQRKADGLQELALTPNVSLPSARKASCEMTPSKEVGTPTPPSIPADSFSNETATIIPTMSASSLDIDAAQEEMDE